MKHYAQMMLLILLCLLMFCTSALAKSVPYTVKLDATVKIYQGHGVDYGYSKRVGEDGVYTIVEEAFDEYRNLWGRLKSGAGWVMLEAAKQISVPQEQITAQKILYTVFLDAGEPIYEDIGSFSVPDKFVGENGVYSIIEEIFCEGLLWGYLKSGAGWVQLSDVPAEAAPLPSADYYRVELGAWVPIYSVPGCEKGICAGIVGEDGVYTIVAETEDGLGNIWGKLKSGAGWVNLNYVRFMGHPPMTAYFADVIDSIDPNWCDCIVDDSEYMVRIAFRANEPLNNLKFTTLRYGDVYEVEENHYWIYWLDEGEFFVAGVVFYGDMTTYGISCVDEEGEERYYAVSLSGMDGSLVMNEYIQ